MAEGVEDIEEGGAAPVSTDSGLAAVALASAKRRRGASQPDAKLDAFLEKQGRLIDLQAEHLHEQRELVLSRLRWGRLSDRLKAVLQALTVLVGLTAAGAVALMAWQAHEDHGVAIAAFSVPPDFVQRGVTGQVVASQLLDRLADLQARTITARPASTYANDWGADIKVEIPETGVSIGELNRWLREWLGHETRITGEVIRTASGVSVTARGGGAPGQTFDGTEGDLNRLVQQAAESVYAQTQPYRYAAYLQSSGRQVDAEKAYARVAATGSAEDRPWALTAWGSLLASQRDFKGAAEKGHAAIEAGPELGEAYAVAYMGEFAQSHREAALSVARLAARRLGGRTTGAFPAEQTLRIGLGDFLGGTASAPRTETLSAEGMSGFYLTAPVQAINLAQDHDISGARALLARVDPAAGAQAVLSPQNVESYCRFVLDDWAGVIAAPANYGSLTFVPIAYAKSGQIKQAQAMVASSPMDCDDCVVNRGIVAAAAHDWTEADRRFAEVTRRSPSTPFAPTEWGRALLAKGDLDRAIEKLAEAHRRGPHYADALELWGEALVRKGDLKGAASKFAEADKYAPKWGRNHLRWGEALMLSGHYAEARAQYEAANGLDLSKPDRAALDVLLVRTNLGPLHG
jgi:tetratricopeptide (TPR) repeat protein